MSLAILQSPAKLRVEMNEEMKNAKEKVLDKLASGEYKEHFNGCICAEHDKGDILVATVDRYGFPLNTFLCMNCGLLRSDPYFDEKSLATFYNSEYDKIYRTTLPENTFFLQQLTQGNKIFSLISQLTSVHHKMKIMEIGCSMGGNLLPFAQMGCDVYGCDYNEIHIKKGQKMGLNLFAGSYATLNNNSPYDVIIASHVIEHFLNPFNSLKEIFQLLKPGGLIYVAVPAVEDIPTSYNCDIFSWLQNAHVYNFSNRTLKNLIIACGGKVLWDNSKGILIAQKIQEPSNILAAPREAYKIMKKLKMYERKKNMVLSVSVFRKLIKMCLPYGVVRFIQMTKN